MRKAFDLTDRNRQIKGVATLLKTPFDNDSRLDESSYRRQVRHVIDAGTVLLIPGMLGCETYCLSPAEREKCIAISLEEANGRIPVCAAVGGVGIHEVVNAAQQADKIGADMVAVIPPPWVARESQAAQCLMTVAESVQLPVMVHTIYGGPSNKVFGVGTLVGMVQSHPNIRYMKIEGPRWVRQIKAMQAEVGDILLGMMAGPNFVMSYRAGCTLFMTAGDVIEPVIAIFEALRSGDEILAEQIESKMLGVICFKSYIGGENTNKAILKRRGIFSNSRLGKPSLFDSPDSLCADEEEQLLKALAPLMQYFKQCPPIGVVTNG